MDEAISKLPARRRILEAASELFYRQGYRGTGVSEIIELADVAKATFYAHFGSKQALCLKYLEDKNLAELAKFRASIESHTDPLQRFLAPARITAEVDRECGHRGCRFVNIAAETPDPESPLRKAGYLHYEALRKMLRELTEELRHSDLARYRSLDSHSIAESYLLLISGGLVTAQLYTQAWPSELIEQAVTGLLGSHVSS